MNDGWVYKLSSFVYMLCLQSLKPFKIKAHRLDAWDKCLDLVHGEDPVGLGGEGGGRGDWDGEYM